MTVQELIEDARLALSVFEILQRLLVARR